MLRKLIVSLLTAIGVGLTLTVGFATGLGFLGGFHFALDLLGCCPLQFAVLMVPAVVIFLLRRRWIWLLLATAVLVVNGWSVAKPRLRDAPRIEDRLGTVKVLRINLGTRGLGRPELETFIAESRPDILVASFCTGAWVERLKTLLKEPWGGAWHSVRTGDRATIISRYPLTPGARPKGSGGHPISLGFPGAPLRLFGIHASQPTSSSGWSRNNGELHAVVTAVGPHPTRTIVVGDFNATPWSYAFLRFVANADLHDTRIGFGNHPTWPAGFLTNASAGLADVLRIPIDHCLVSRDIGVVERRVGPYCGDPHLPVLITLEIGTPQPR